MESCIKNIINFEDFANVYKVFESFPFFEKWTPDEIRQQFEMNTANGNVFGYYVNDQCVGFISIRKPNHNEHPIKYDHQTKVVYISDLAVLPEYRRRGIATELLNFAINFATSKGYEYAYLRINENNPMAFDIAKKQGFSKKYDCCEVVTRETLKKKKPAEDFRIFMTKKL